MNPNCEHCIHSGDYKALESELAALRRPHDDQLRELIAKDYALAEARRQVTDLQERNTELVEERRRVEQERDGLTIKLESLTSRYEGFVKGATESAQRLNAQIEQREQQWAKALEGRDEARARALPVRAVAIVSPEAVHANNLAKGHLDGLDPSRIPDINHTLMLVCSEAGEAVDGLRNGIPFGAKGGMAEELADIVLRVFGIAVWLGIDILKAVETKHQYNLTRPYKHGKAGDLQAALPPAAAGQKQEE